MNNLTWTPQKKTYISKPNLKKLKKKYIKKFVHPSFYRNPNYGLKTVSTLSVPQPNKK